MSGNIDLKAVLIRIVVAVRLMMRLQVPLSLKTYSLQDALNSAVLNVGFHTGIESAG